ncbi:2-oxoglutarate (2OG) and Fe(II)-dependent oxygenase superfamily protein [Rhynchospora pubera]|uniref:2-oxoglutarate (2OG) and Fe(II)-dependent oxygenase superfamily protein n=1 Tax=Rhynchospora pubera TaxID=906938 RepID=A0AAV8GNF9_9POAL|nr:2-oxoglutarate (2OG) and Fe(II)-dependent oxygenase superfamily protein [Rhynchospora pubera]
MGQTVLVDQAFVQPQEHRPKTVVSDADDIPLIDLSPLSSDSDVTSAPETLLAQVEAACRDWGFFQVINHGVSPELLRKAEATQREFFALPDEEKRKVRQDEQNALGYYEAEHTKNVRDWKEVFDIIAHEQDEIDVVGLVLKNKWPQVPLGFRETFEEYAKSVEKLAFRLLELIALSLNLPPKKLNIFFEKANSLLRLNYYRPCPNPDLVLGVGRHRDPGALTVLYQDSTGGLDVKRQSDGEWIQVKPISNAFIINVGDTFQVWSNDKYTSAEHRVSVNSEKDRISIPFFLQPASCTNVRPLEELTDDKNPAKYNEYSYGEFIRARKDGNLKKLEVQNIQIDHFKRAQ